MIATKENAISRFYSTTVGYRDSDLPHQSGFAPTYSSRMELSLINIFKWDAVEDLPISLYP